MSTPNALSTARHLSQLLLSAADLSRDIFAEIADEAGVPVQTARALCLLDSPAPMSQLATKFACDKSYITPLAAQLEALGLVTRTPGSDRRTKLLELTPHGISVQTALGNQIARRSPVIASLSDDERETLELLLTKLLRNN